MADVRLFNKGKSHITGVHSDIIDPETKKKKKFSFGPNENAAFSPADAANLRRLYPNQIVSLEDVKRQFDEPEQKAPSPSTISIEEAEKVKQAAIKQAVAEALERAEATRIAEDAAAEELKTKPDENPLEKQETIATPKGAKASGNKLFGAKKK